MTSAMLPGQTPVAEALDNAQTFELVSSDGAESSLAFRNLQAGIMNAGLNVTAAAPEGLKGSFNTYMAAAVDLNADPAAVQPSADQTLDEQVSVTQGGYDPTKLSV